MKRALISDSNSNTATDFIVQWEYGDDAMRKRLCDGPSSSNDDVMTSTNKLIKTRFHVNSLNKLQTKIGKLEQKLKELSAATIIIDKNKKKIKKNF